MGGGVTFLATPPNRAMTLSSRGRATDEKATLLRRRCNEARELILMAGESVKSGTQRRGANQFVQDGGNAACTTPSEQRAGNCRSLCPRFCGGRKQTLDRHRPSRCRRPQCADVLAGSCATDDFVSRRRRHCRQRIKLRALVQRRPGDPVQVGPNAGGSEAKTLFRVRRRADEGPLKY